MKPTHSEQAGYHQFGDGDGAYGSFEVFYASGLHGGLPGWYWMACFPGCLPDGEASGPFATSQEAYDDAKAD